MCLASQPLHRSKVTEIYQKPENLHSDHCALVAAILLVLQENSFPYLLAAVGGRSSQEMERQHLWITSHIETASDQPISISPSGVS
jgi:hypothetical protein